VKSSTPEVTVLMPVHNGAAHVLDAARSILDQTFADFELLVVDDASTDGTGAILQGLSDPRVRVVRNADRMRLPATLNRGMALARGRLIARMDADDIARPGRLACQSDFLRRHPEIGLCGGRARHIGLRRGVVFRPPLSHAEVLSYTLFDSPFVHPTVIWRREAFERHRLRFDADYVTAQDYELWSRAVRLLPAANVDRILLDYRVHSLGTSATAERDQDARAAQVAARELAALGVPGDHESVQFHRRLGRGRCFPIRGRADLSRAERWLGTLLAANTRERRYPEPAFRRTVAGVWYSACYHAGALGFWTLRRYLSSPHRRAASANAKEWAGLVLAAARRRSL
jgi:glycosyltransferase involved in cell wall biosynthesis